jgi:hypothetical protein
LPLPKRAGVDRQIDFVITLLALIEHDQSGRVVEGQRLEKNGANNSKDRCVTSETESDQEDSGEGEPRSAGETLRSRKKSSTEVQLQVERVSSWIVLR